MNLLLVEDEAAIRDALAAFLRIKGHRVTTAASREEGLATIAAGDLDVLITDWRIGGGDGGALVVACACPAIVVSGANAARSPDVTHQAAAPSTPRAAASSRFWRRSRRIPVNGAGGARPADCPSARALAGSPPEIRWQSRSIASATAQSAGPAAPGRRFRSARRRRAAS